MSVNAISGSVQPVSSDNRYAGLGTGVVVGGGLGATAGYLWRGTTPDFKQFCALEGDQFTKAKDAITKKNEEAAKKVVEARETYKQGIADVATKTQEAQTALDAAVEKMEVAGDVASKAEEAQKALDETIVKVKEGENEVEKAFSLLAEDQKNSEAVKTAVAEKQTALDEAKEALKKAKTEAFEEKAKEAGSDAAKLKKALEDAVKTQNEAETKTMNDVLKEEVTQAYKKVRRALTEGKGKAAIGYGALGAAVLGTVGYFVGKSFTNNKEEA